MREWIDSNDASEVMANMNIGETRIINLITGLWTIKKVSNNFYETEYTKIENPNDIPLTIQINHK